MLLSVGPWYLRGFLNDKMELKFTARCKKIPTALSGGIKSLYINLMSVPACWDFKKMSIAVQAAY